MRRADDPRDLRKKKANLSPGKTVASRTYLEKGLSTRTIASIRPADVRAGGSAVNSFADQIGPKKGRFFAVMMRVQTRARS